MGQSSRVDPESQSDQSHIIHGALDSDWIGYFNHCKSVSGIIITHLGDTMYYKINFLDTIAMSSTEARFTAARERRKANIIYIHSFLSKVNVQQDKITTLFIDINGALFMVNDEQPTRGIHLMNIL